MTDDGLKELGITIEDIIAYRKHKAILRRCGRAGRSKYTTKDTDWYDDYAESAKWNKELQAKEARKNKWATKKKDQMTVSDKAKAPTDKTTKAVKRKASTNDDVHSVSDSSQTEKAKGKGG